MITKRRPCRYCGQPIVFALVPSTTRRPFDAKPHLMYVLSGSAPNLQARPAPVYSPHECSERKSA